MAPASAEFANTVGWYILEGYPWWPVYVCDQFKLRPNLHMLGDGHKRILKKARDFPNDYAIVYFFGSGEFSLASLKKNVLKPWDCEQREQFLKGHPAHVVKKSGTADDLKDAILVAEDYLSQPEDTRLPPHMVPSDLDPTLEPPPPMERPPMDEDEEDGGDGDEEMASDAEEEGDDDDGDAEEDVDASEDDGEEKKKTKAKTKAKKEKAKSTKKEKTEKPKKEKKPAKEKKESAALKKKKTAEDEEDGNAKGKLKRQRSSSSANGAEEEKQKQAKRDKKEDVKSAANGATEESPEDLSAILEREIRWIISNVAYEEMTTKMVRKMLEERLKRDLRKHRDMIKVVVQKVLESIDDEDSAAGAGAADVPMEDADKTDVKKEEDAVKKEAPPAVVKKEEPIPEPAAEEKVKVEDENGSSGPPLQAEVDVKKLIEAKTELSLAVDDEKKIGSVIASLKKLTTVDKVQLVESGLLPKLVELRGHRKQSVGLAVGELAAQWKLEDEIPAPKPVQVEDILKLKEKLEVPETSHDEVLATLNELEHMALDLSHLKDTGIARSVAKLRQHANDKVSIAAKNLRNAWMQLADKDKQPDNLKTLVQMNEVLESESESQQAKLTVLKKLIKMSLTTKEIIDSKIGVVVSKLRKSNDADVATAANKLRKKWRSEVSSA